MFIIYVVYLLGCLLAIELSKSRLQDNIQGMSLAIFFSWITVIAVLFLDYKKIRGRYNK